MTQAEDLAHAFHTALVAGDWEGLRRLFTDDATWTLPGENRISGSVEGGAAVVERARKIAAYGLKFELKHVLLSRDNMALSLRNTAERDGLRLDEDLATVCRLREGLISEVETFLSDVEGMDAFFSVEP